MGKHHVSLKLKCCRSKGCDFTKQSCREMYNHGLCTKTISHVKPFRYTVFHNSFRNVNQLKVKPKAHQGSHKERSEIIVDWNKVRRKIKTAENSLVETQALIKTVKLKNQNRKVKKFCKFTAAIAALTLVKRTKFFAFTSNVTIFLIRVCFAKNISRTAKTFHTIMQQITKK